MPNSDISASGGGTDWLSTAVLVAGGTAAVAATFYLVLKPLYERFLRRDVPFGPETHPVIKLLLRRRPVHASHRGGARAWPENTMLAYRSAAAVDAAAVDAAAVDAAAVDAAAVDAAGSSALGSASAVAVNSSRARSGCTSRLSGDGFAPGEEAGVGRHSDAADAAAAGRASDDSPAVAAVPLLRTQLLEVDVQLTKDQQLVLIHNVTVDDTTDGSGLVESYTLEELRSLDAGYHFTRDGGKTFPYRGKGLQIPTLKEVFDEFAGYKDLVFYLDFKLPKAVAPTLEMVREYGLEQRILMGAVPPIANREVLRLKPKFVPATPDLHSMILMYICYVVGILWLIPMRHEMVGTTAYRWGYKVLNRDFVAAFHKRGRWVSVFGDYIDHKEGQEECIAMGCDMLFSDRPDILHDTISMLQS
ncbi:hypothetical protein CLOM_g8285 [Closterium sp. NIES-68]|nr:hypothetical protein CLOM_g20816 [Closterium sp. NIES-68]GJP49024.1 hypothetical protein CLOM_g8285 [Closterium sp. NIES-68]GJP69907.1 hypothetical protein CLOP_g906 [Closterium sp. NIES-67]GJP73748.1 hypothetical protein CLOP_g4435 [Closterium sp. NIES-67]